MPDHSALIGGVSQIIGTGVDALATSQQNRKSRKWSEQMYERQKNDNIAFWNQQNAYNSPEAQMKRLKEAGLNPALMYGGSSGGGGQASPIKTPDVQPRQFRTPEFGGAVRNIGSFIDFEIKQAQKNNLNTQATANIDKAILTRAQSDKTKFDLAQTKRLADVSADVMYEQLRQLKTGIDIQIDENTRRAQMHGQNLKQALANTARLQMGTKQAQEMIKQIKADTQLKRLDIELRKVGITSKDPMWARIITTIFKQLRLNPNSEWQIEIPR